MPIVYDETKNRKLVPITSIINLVEIGWAQDQSGAGITYSVSAGVLQSLANDAQKVNQSIVDKLCVAQLQRENMTGRAPGEAESRRRGHEVQGRCRVRQPRPLRARLRAGRCLDANVARSVRCR